MRRQVYTLPLQHYQKQCWIPAKLFLLQAGLSKHLLKAEHLYWVHSLQEEDKLSNSRTSNIREGHRRLSNRTANHIECCSATTNIRKSSLQTQMWGHNLQSLRSHCWYRGFHLQQDCRLDQTRSFLPDLHTTCFAPDWESSSPIWHNR